MSFKRACHVTIGRAWSVPSTPHMIQIVRDCLPLSLPRRRGDAMLGCVRYHYHRLNYLMEVKFHSHFPCRGMRKANRKITTTPSLSPSHSPFVQKREIRVWKKNRRKMMIWPWHALMSLMYYACLLIEWSAKADPFSLSIYCIHFLSNKSV